MVLTGQAAGTLPVASGDRMSTLALPVKTIAFSGSRRPDASDRPGQARGASTVSPWNAIQSRAYTIQNNSLLLIFGNWRRYGIKKSPAWEGAGTQRLAVYFIQLHPARHPASDVTGRRSRLHLLYLNPYRHERKYIPGGRLTQLEKAF